MTIEKLTHEIAESVEFQDKQDARVKIATEIINLYHQDGAWNRAFTEAFEASVYSEIASDE